MSSASLPFKNVSLCYPLLIPIYYTGKSRRTLLGAEIKKKKSRGIVSEARAVSVHLQLLPYSSR